MSALRTCTGCGEDLPCTAEYFEWDGKGYLRHRCRSCRKAYWNAYHRERRASGAVRARPYAAAFNERRRAAYQRDPETRRAQNRTWYAKKRWERAEVVISLLLERSGVTRQTLLFTPRKWAAERALAGTLSRYRSALIYVLHRQRTLTTDEIMCLMGADVWVIEESIRRVRAAIRCHAGRGRKKNYRDPDLRDLIDNILDELWELKQQRKETRAA